MNRILIDPAELSDVMALSGPRAQHIHAVLKSAPGDTVKIGVIDGACGKAEVLATTPENAQLKILSLDEVSIEPWCDVLLALPRPRAMKRLWPQLATLGVGNIHLLDAAKVEKTYFASHVIDPETFTPLLIDGLMQSGATILPRVHIHPRIKTFFAEILPTLLTPNTLPLLAHPGSATPHSSLLTPNCFDVRPLLAIGPDGGWTAEEQEKFFAAGFTPFSLGERPLRTDTACVALLATLHYLLAIANYRIESIPVDPPRFDSKKFTP